MTKCQLVKLLGRTWLVGLLVPSRNIQVGGSNSLRGMSVQDVKSVHRDPRSQQQQRGLIIGGNVATPSRYPYYVHLDDISCGGSLIAPDIVLTAGHVSSLWCDTAPC